MGGGEIDRLRDYRCTSVWSDGRNEDIVNLSGKLLAVGRNILGKSVYDGYDGSTAWERREGEGARELSDTRFLEEKLFRQPLFLLNRFDKSQWSVRAVGSADVNGRPANAVLIVNLQRGFEVTVYIDAESKLMTRMAYPIQYARVLTSNRDSFQVDPQGGAAEMMTLTYSEFHEVAGVTVPGMQTSGTGFQARLSFEINPGIPEDSYRVTGR